MHEPLFRALSRSLTEFNKELQNWPGANLHDAVDKAGYSLLQVALGHGHSLREFFRVMDGAGHPAKDQVEKRNALGETVVLTAARMGNLQAMHDLLEVAGAEILEKDSAQNGVLHLAAKFGRLEVVEALLSTGLDQFQHPNAHLLEPLHLAATEGHMRVLEAFVQRGRMALPCVVEEWPSRLARGVARQCHDRLLEAVDAVALREIQSSVTPENDRQAWTDDLSGPNRSEEAVRAVRSLYLSPDRTEPDRVARAMACARAAMDRPVDVPLWRAIAERPNVPVLPRRGIERALNIV